MNFIIMAFITGFIGSVPLLLAKKPTPYIIFSIIYALIAWVMYYFAMPCLDYSLGGWVFGTTLLFSIISCVISTVISEEVKTVSVLPSGGGILLLLVFLMSGFGGCNTGRYSSLVGNMDINGKTLKHWTQQNQELSPSHIRIVPEEHAIAIAKTALNQNPDEQGDIVGSQFPLSDEYATMQKVNDELYYVIPLDFKGWGVWNNTSGVPGYVLVNAENQHMRPKYVDGYKMKYTPNSCFSENLERHLYTHGYSDKILSDYSFEVDDNLKPYWVVSVGHHTIGMYSGIVIDGVVVVDPETGEITDYKKDKVPAWIDRVIPASVVNDNLSYWGSYAKGFWNRTGAGASSNLRKPETSVLNYGADGTCWYVTPMTSILGKDETMTDLVYTNSRTGQSHRYSVSGSTENRIIATVDATVKFQNLHGAAVVYENVADRLTALVPILAEDHSIRGLAFVDVSTKSIYWDPEPTNALMKYQAGIGGMGSAIGTDIAVTELMYKGVVGRISQSYSSSGNTYYMYFKDKTHLYLVPETFREVIITQPGDSVSIKYLDSKSDLVSITAFNNLNITIESSKNQKDAQFRAQSHSDTERKTSSRKSAVGTIRNKEISDEMLDSLAKKINKNP